MEQIHSGNKALIPEAPYSVFIGSSCNLNCLFCNSPSNRNDLTVPNEKIIQEIKNAASREAAALVFTGGEPAINKVLPALISIAGEYGFSSIGVRTNGLMFSYMKFCEKLIKCGLSFAEVMFISRDESLFEEVTRGSGLCQSALAGISNLSQCGIPLKIVIPVIRETLLQTPDNIRFLISKFESIKKIEFIIPKHGLEYHLPDFEDIEAVLNESLNICMQNGIDVSTEPYGGLQPCLFESPASLLRIFNYPTATYLKNEQFLKTPVCYECHLDVLCNGVRSEFREIFESRENPAIGRRLAAVVVRQSMMKDMHVKRKNVEADKIAQGDAVTISRRENSDGSKTINECIIRTNFRCNQNCMFCFVDKAAKAPPGEIISDTAEMLRQSGNEVSIISLSGGEPTLNKDILHYLDILNDVSHVELCLQTNAVLIDSIAKAVDMASHGLNSAFVSLHSHDEEISDLLTGAPGTFLKSVQGIQNLISAGIYVYISHVINSFNYSTLPEFVEFVHRKLNGVPIVFSFVAPHRESLLFRGIIPHLTKVKPYLEESLNMCLEKKIPFSGIPGMCGTPFCILGPDLRYYPDIHLVDKPSLEGAMVKNAGCSDCSLDDYCYGLRKYYAEFFGDKEISPLHIDNFVPEFRDMISRISFFKNFY